VLLIRCSLRDRGAVEGEWGERLYRCETWWGLSACFAEGGGFLSYSFGSFAKLMVAGITKVSTRCS